MKAAGVAMVLLVRLHAGCEPNPQRSPVAAL
jgi:hypothetical protein